MKRTIIIAAIVAACTAVYAQERKADMPDYSYKNWVRNAPRYTDDFLKTDEAKRIAGNVLLYQQTTGGWPKNIKMERIISSADSLELLKEKENVNESTIDNDATSTEIRFLTRMYVCNGNRRYLDAAVRGINYILDSQYDNGGWPQFWPRNYGYYTHITYNDRAMVNVMELLREVYTGKAPYDTLPKSTRRKARKAFDNGIKCILNTQIKDAEGNLTVWCAQHDEKTLAPAKARAYELPSYSGAESFDIVMLLMSLENPSQSVCKAIEGAVQWLEDHKIERLKRENFINADGKRDYRMVESADSEPLWARFYDLETGKPFFCDRDGVKKSDVSDIGYERRNGYGWYSNRGQSVLKRYAKWKEENR
jgi:pectinesterase